LCTWVHVYIHTYAKLYLHRIHTGKNREKGFLMPLVENYLCICICTHELSNSVSRREEKTLPVHTYIHTYIHTVCTHMMCDTCSSSTDCHKSRVATSPGANPTILEFTATTPEL
jgi:hypothetical protein